MTKTFDVVVIGNGAIGLMLARAIKLHTPATTVAVVGSSSRDGSASTAAGAMLGCFGEVTAPTLATDVGRAKFALARSAHRRWPDLLVELQAEVGGDLASGDGSFVIYNARSGYLDAANFAALTASLDEFDEPHEFVDHVPGLFATPQARPLRSLFLPSEHGVDARRLVAAMERTCVRLGVQVLDDTVSDILVEGGRAVGVLLGDDQELSCGAVAVAAGVWSGNLLERVLGPHAVQPILSGTGMALLAERTQGTPFPSVVRSVNRAGSCGLHVVPLGGKHVYFGATNVVYPLPEGQPHLGIVHFLTQCVIEQIDQRSSFAKISEVLMGNRPVPLDTFPLLGPAGLAGLYLFTGTYRDGLHASPEIGDLGARLILDGQNGFDLRFDPLRRPIETMSQRESIDAFAAQNVSSAFESATALSEFLNHEQLLAVFAPRAEALYERLGWGGALPTDLLDALVLNDPPPGSVEAIRAYLSSV